MAVAKSFPELFDFLARYRASKSPPGLEGIECLVFSQFVTFQEKRLNFLRVGDSVLSPGEEENACDPLTPLISRHLFALPLR